MKKLIFALIAISLVGCSSAPRKVLMKNCERTGHSGLFYCEEIPKKELGGRQR